MRLSHKNSFVSNKSDKQSIKSVIKDFSDASALAQPPNTNYQLVADSSNYTVGSASHQNGTKRKRKTNEEQ